MRTTLATSSKVGVSWFATDRMRSPGWIPAAAAPVFGQHVADDVGLRRPDQREERRQDDDREQEVGRGPGEDDQEALPHRPHLERRGRAAPGGPIQGRRARLPATCRRRISHSRRAAANRFSSAYPAGRSSRPAPGRTRSRMSRPECRRPARPDSGQAHGRRRAGPARRRTRSGSAKGVEFGSIYGQSAVIMASARSRVTRSISSTSLIERGAP